MSCNDTQYFRGRAEFERDLAASCHNPAVAQVHLEMAQRYEALINDGGRRTLKLVRTRCSSDGARSTLEE